MKKVLITGATGFAGKHLTTYLESLGNYSVVGTYISSKPDDRQNIKFVHLDLSNADAVKECIDSVLPEHIYHLAALTSPTESLENPAKTITNNITAQINLLEAVKNSASETSKILIISSADVYGKVSNENIPIDEETPMNPTNPYAVSKVSQDLLGLQYYLAFDMNILRVRPFNHFGPGQEPKFVVPAFAKQIAEIEKGKIDPVIKVGNLEQKKDFSDVRDIVRGYHVVMEKGKIGDVYNMGSGKSIKVADILDYLIGMSESKIEIEKDDSLFRPVMTPDFLCDPAKIFNELSWHTEIPLQESLKDTLDYWRKVL